LPAVFVAGVGGTGLLRSHRDGGAPEVTVPELFFDLVYVFAITQLSHAERNQLVLLIALGESILAVGATFAVTHWTAATTGALVVGFVATAALWWIYFGRSEEAAAVIQRADDPAYVARGGFAYAHALMVFGVIVLAVAIDLTIAAPTAPSRWQAAATLLGGPILYLLGNTLYKRSLAGAAPHSRLVGLVATGCLLPLALAADRLVLSMAATLVLLAIAATTTRNPTLR
jgi:low temperature requirement protein LtrA